MEEVADETIYLVIRTIFAKLWLRVVLRYRIVELNKELVDLLWETHGEAHVADWLRL